MEAIHKPEIRPWILPGKVKVREFMELWSQSQIEMELRINRENLAQTTQMYLNIDADMMSLLEEDCRPSILNSDADDEGTGIYTAYEKTIDIPANIPLETLRLQREHQELYKNDRSYRTAVLQSARYRNNPIKIEKSTEATSNVPQGQISTPEVILTVQLFRPIRQETHYGLTHRYSFIADQELDVLGCQTLAELRDTFICVSDISNPGDCSENPKDHGNLIASDMYKSSCFFINNTFYNDGRDECNMDYSKVITDWAKEPGRGIGALNTLNMEDTRFIDLELQLGYPYLYMHQGDCEHVLVFSDIRVGLLNQRSDYPKIVSTNRRMQVRCGICNLNTSKWVTFNNKRLPQDPSFFCDTCFHFFNYDEEGKKKSQFKAYPYLDKTALL